MKTFTGVLAAFLALSQVSGNAISSKLEALKLSIDENSQNITDSIGKFTELLGEVINGPLAWRQEVAKVRQELSTIPKNCAEDISKQLDDVSKLTDHCPLFTEVIALVENTTLAGFRILGDVAAAAKGVSGIFHGCSGNPFELIECIAKDIESIKAQFFFIEQDSNYFKQHLDKIIEDIGEYQDICGTKQQAAFETALAAAKSNLKSCSHEVV